MQPATHTAIAPSLCGEPVSLAPGRAVVRLTLTPAMAVDARGLVHGGFVFGLADYAAMLAVNDPFVVLGAADVRFLAPTVVGEILEAEAVAETDAAWPSRSAGAKRTCSRARSPASSWESTSSTSSAAPGNTFGSCIKAAAGRDEKEKRHEFRAETPRPPGRAAGMRLHLLPEAGPAFFGSRKKRRRRDGRTLLPPLRRAKDHGLQAGGRREKLGTGLIRTTT
jgi:hypothetical protein